VFSKRDAETCNASGAMKSPKLLRTNARIWQCWQKRRDCIAFSRKTFKQQRFEAVALTRAPEN